MPVCNDAVCSRRCLRTHSSEPCLRDIMMIMVIRQLLRDQMMMVNHQLLENRTSLGQAAPDKDGRPAGPSMPPGMSRSSHAVPPTQTAGSTSSRTSLSNNSRLYSITTPTHKQLVVPVPEQAFQTTLGCIQSLPLEARRSGVLPMQGHADHAYSSCRGTPIMRTPPAGQSCPWKPLRRSSPWWPRSPAGPCRFRWSSDTCPSST